MLQTWVALPEADEESPPAFANYQPEQLPVVTEGGLWMRLIAGTAYGLSNDVKTHSPLFYVHALLEPATSFGLPRGHAERAAYVARGRISVEGRDYVAGQMLVFSRDADPKIIAVERSALMLLGGEPVGERHIWWNFVSSRKERIEEAKADWVAGRIPLPPNDNAEFIPLPEDRRKTPGPEPLS